VAAEVRSLAERSAVSAREIKHLIKDTVTKIDNGSAHVSHSGETLHEIARSIKRVADMVAEISTACSEQALAIENVNIAVSRVDSVTRTNAAQSEQLFATAKQLLSKSVELQEMVSSFDIGSDSAPVSLTATSASQPMVFRGSPVLAGTGFHE
jgi:methyl-accepting chemotaxis protein